MRIAALYDIHGNLPALRVVLAEVARAGIETVVVGGDVAAGPFPRECIEQLMALGDRARFVRGNADREVVEAFDQGRLDPDQVDGVAEQEAAFAAARLTQTQRDFLAAFTPGVVLDIDGLGPTMFCHGSPTSDSEIITTATSENRLRAILAETDVATVLGGHTHRQFDRRLEQRRFVNAGSVGRPYEGRAGAFWATLGPEVVLRRTDYDPSVAAAEMRATGFPNVENFLQTSLLNPSDPDEIAAIFERLNTPS